MNNKYFACLICICVLTLAPACKKSQPVASKKEDVKTMIELDNTVFEMEEAAEAKKSIVKF